MKQYHVYIMTNPGQTALYTGVTSQLVKRVHEHKEKLNDGFTKQYNCTKLVYFEDAPDPQSAILREKQIKAGSRQKKLDLIRSSNPDWDDLYQKIASA